MNSRGLTIVEVLISMAIFFTVTGIYFTFSGLNSSNKANIEKKLASKDVMLQNLIEIKGIQLRLCRRQESAEFARTKWTGPSSVKILFLVIRVTVGYRILSMEKFTS
ncbi:MAG: prepilin-type N-terminal cleavage/methylation domain-containing protein [Bdellovibrionaceae bacterium]|nr:prepilin-type N-terminal cleavage/methylation domain-containing protein [Pseudobdellovibrionaceae bacterium]